MPIQPRTSNHRRNALDTIDTELLLARPGSAPATGPHRIEINAEGRIAAIGPGGSDGSDTDDDPIGQGVATLPPLTDAHDHGRGIRTLAFGALDEPLESWILDLMHEPVVPPYLRALVSFARMAEGGVAAANHCHNPQSADVIAEAKAVSDAARTVGVRIAFAVPILDQNPITYDDPTPLLETVPPAVRKALVDRRDRVVPADEQLAWVDEIANFEHDCFEVQYGPRGAQWVSELTWGKIADASARTGRRVHMHLMETERQKRWAAQTHPGGAIRWLDQLGVLSTRLTGAHGIWLDEADIERMADRGVTVSINPSSNLRLKSGVAAVNAFMRHGLRFGLGLDSMAFDDDEDMLRELRLLYRLHRDPNWGMQDQLSLGRAWHAAAVDGRRTVVRDSEAPPLTPGALADFMLLDWAAISADAMPDAAAPIHLITARMTKRHLKRLVVGGRTIVEDGAVQTVDLPAAAAELTAIARHAWENGPKNRRPMRDALTHAICHHCTGST